MTPCPFQGYNYTGPPGIGLSEAAVHRVRLHPITPARNEAITCRFVTPAPGVALSIQGWMDVHWWISCSWWLFMVTVHDDRSWWLFMMIVHDDCSWWLFMMIVLQVLKQCLIITVMVDHHYHGWSSLSWLIIIIMFDHHYHVWSSLSCLIIIVKKNIFMIFFRFLYGNIFKIKYS